MNDGCMHSEGDKLAPGVCIPCLPEPGPAWLVIGLAVAYASCHFIPWAWAGFPVVGQ